MDKWAFGSFIIYNTNKINFYFLKEENTMAFDLSNFVID